MSVPNATNNQLELPLEWPRQGDHVYFLEGRSCFAGRVVEKYHDGSYIVENIYYDSQKDIFFGCWGQRRRTPKVFRSSQEAWLEVEKRGRNDF